VPLPPDLNLIFPDWDLCIGLIIEEAGPIYSYVRLGSSAAIPGRSHELMPLVPKESVKIDVHKNIKIN